MGKHICKYCGKEFDTSQKLGGHVSKCINNPNYKNTIKQIGLAKHKYANFKEYTFNCEICNSEYKLILSENNYNNHNYRKTCSDECAKILTAKNTNKQEKNNKISIAINKYKCKYKNIKSYICEECGKQFLNINDYNSKRFCSKECSIKHKSIKLSESAKKIILADTIKCLEIKHLNMDIITIFIVIVHGN